MLSHSECEIAVVDSEAVLARVAAMRRSLPKLRRIICIDLAGPRPRLEGETARVLVHPWDEVVKKGQARLAKGDRQFDLRAAAVTAADTATIVYTSGTSGRPKGVVLTHGNLMHNVTTMHTAVAPQPGMTWLSVHARLERLRTHRGVLQPLLRHHHRLLPALGVEDGRGPGRPQARLPRRGAGPARGPPARPRAPARLPGLARHQVREVLRGLRRVHRRALPPVPARGAGAGDLRGHPAARAAVAAQGVHPPAAAQAHDHPSRAAACARSCAAARRSPPGSTAGTTPRASRCSRATASPRPRPSSACAARRRPCSARRGSPCPTPR